MKTPLRRRIKLIGLATLLTAVGPIGARAQGLPDLPFTSASTGADGALSFRPNFSPGRAEGSTAYDEARQQLVLFGGYRYEASARPSDQPVLFGDTWLWGSGDWTRASGSSPGGRTFQRLVYDAARQEVLQFGGYSPGSVHDETWIWNGTDWSQRSVGTHPDGRYNPGLTFDAARQEVVLFGGGGWLLHDDTWVWNGSGWATKSFAQKPAARQDTAMVYDEARRNVVLFGGYGAGAVCFGDTWIWNGTNWQSVTPSNSPSPRSNHAMTYDRLRQEVVLFGGYSCQSNSVLGDTWVWDGTNWTQRNPVRSPEPRSGHSLAFHSARGVSVLTGGGANSFRVRYDTWLWDGTNWSPWSGQLFDMSARPNGIWNFSSIDVPAGVTVGFKPNAANTPVRWLATSNVIINGTIDVSGSGGLPWSSIGGVGVAPAEGGPGGFKGGLGGIANNPSYAGMPGQGPGGGLAGANRLDPGQAGRYASMYGNPYIQPLIGGSGGGGGGGRGDYDGGSGGGGGGAILISSSRDIVINGAILANGGSGSQPQSISSGGNGSGGAIRLQADRITINGSVQANNDGRIRLEAFYLTVNRATQPAHVPAAPTLTREFDTSTNLLLITSVAGQNVVQPPRGELLNPDVIFSEPGPISVTVRGTNISDGSLARLRVTTSGGLLTPSAIPLTNGLAMFSLTVPRGYGTLQAFADFTLASP